MNNTPSMGIDQNGDKKFIDRFYGRIPVFLRYIPEAFICDVNPEYVELIIAYLDGDINPENISEELTLEIENIVLNYDCPCLLTGEERAVVRAIAYYRLNGSLAGYEGCPPPTAVLKCTGILCCNQIVMCKTKTICTN